jgi:uncharacterized membrane protein
MLQGLTRRRPKVHALCARYAGKKAAVAFWHALGASRLTACGAALKAARRIPAAVERTSSSWLKRPVRIEPSCQRIVICAVLFDSCQQPDRPVVLKGIIRSMLPVQHIHPILVHFPIVFMITLAAFDLIATFRGALITGKTASGNASAGLAVLAGLAAIAAFYFGGLALDFAEAGGFHSDIAEIHEGLGEFTAIAFAIWAAVRGLLWYRDIRFSGPLAISVPAIEIAGAAMVIATAYFGGQLVFDLGVNVAQAAG